MEYLNLDSNLIPILIIFPVALLLFLKLEGMKFDKKKSISIFLIFLLISIPPSFSFQPAYGENIIKRIIKIEGDYPADSAFADFVIHPPLTDLTKSFAVVSFSHTGEADHSDTFRSWEILNSNTLRIYGENTATGNLAEEFIAYVVEYEGDILVQKSSRVWSTSESAGEKSVTFSTPVTLAESMLLSKGHDHDADETTIGSEELDRLRLLTTTTWGQLIFTNPNSSPQNNLVDIIDWNDSGVLAQRGIVTLADGVTSTTVTPSTAIDRTRTILLVTYTCGTGCATAEAVDDIMLRATINTSNQIVITRVGTEDAMQIAWSVIQFPADKVRVHYDSVTMSGGTTITTDTIPEVRDFDKTIVMSTVGTPYGWGTGTCSDTTDGAIDRCMTDIELVNENLVSFERGDSTGTAIIEYQVIQLLEKEYPQATHGTNQIRQIAKVEGTFTAGNVFQDFTISPALVNSSKIMVFMTMNSTNIGESSENGKMWEVISPSTLRIYGSGTAINDGAEFRAKIVEFTNDSPVFAQKDNLQFPEDLADNTRTMWISPVNTSNTFIIGQGMIIEDGDPTFGQEEFPMVTLVNGTRWQFETELQQDSVETAYRLQIVDFNQDDIRVQRGTGTLTGTSIAVSPPVDIDRTNSLVLVNFRTNSGTFGEFPNRTAISATLDASVPTDLVIQRNTAQGGDITFAWQIITFPDDFINVQHGIHSQTAGQFNQTSTITPVGNLSNAFSIGTVGGFYTQSMGRGSSNIENDFDSVFAFMELDNASTLRVIRGDDNGSFDLGFQVAEFLTGGNTFNQTITDFASTIDLSTNKNVTKVQTDSAISTDTVSTGVIYVVNLDDQGVATDVLQINVTKLAQETVSVDDEPSFIISKLLEDIVQVNDTTNIASIFDVEVLDTATGNDLVILNITKQFSDVSSGFDDLNIIATKVFLDTSIVVDTTTTSTDSDVNQTDATNILDNVVLNITKAIQDVSTVSDDVVLIRIRDLMVIDTVTVNDPSILFKISSVVPTGSGTGGGSSGGTSGVPILQRLIGLSITSELFHVKAGDVVPSDFIIQTFGQESSEVLLQSIEPEAGFTSWFRYSAFPDTLRFDTVIDNSRPTVDPARIKNTALNDFILNVPSVECKDLSVFDSPVSCFEEKIYEVPMIFKFKKGGLEFREKHIVIIDGTTAPTCDILCQFIEFINSNWWWLAGIIIMFTVLYLGVTVVNGKKIRVINRIDRRYFTSFEAGRGKPRKKFKKGKGR